MAVTCSRCGTQNPDENQFCLACGTPLAAAPPAVPGGAPSFIPGPPVGMPSPGGRPAQASVHRTSWAMILSAILGLVVVMAACGTGIAVLEHNYSNQPRAGAPLPSPTPAGSPSPIPTPPAGQGGAGVVSNSSLSVTVPIGWIEDKSNSDDQTISLLNPNGDGQLRISSGTGTSMTIRQIQDNVDASLTKQFPDTARCANTTNSNGSVAGVPGIWWQLCFTVASGGQSFQGETTLFAAVNADGSVGYGIVLFTLASRMSSFSSEAQVVLGSIHWKLT